jgi:hypothetical protein
MKPACIKVNQCRVCLSKKILDLRIKKDYYLMNLDQTVSIPYSICSDCHFIFQSEYVGDEFLNHYYKLSPMLRRKDPTIYEVDQNERQSAFLSRHMDLQGISVLEIGAHAGAFLAHLHKRYECETYFDELSDEARNILSSQEGLIDYRLLGKAKELDLVVLRHVLEHVFDLDTFLKYVKSNLKEDGYLYIEVPDWSFLDSNTDPLIFEHLNQFSTYNLILLLGRTGWQCEVVEKNICPDDPATPNRVIRLLAQPSPIASFGDKKIVEDFHKSYVDHYEAGNRAINGLVKKLEKNKTIALYPASHLTFTALLETELHSANIIGMFDIDPKKHGRIISGIEVFPAEKLKDIMPDLILIFTMAYEREIRDYFKSLGLTSEVISIEQFLQ